jgi:pimeloyl-ACP methyl ester carboxylesterase
MTRCLFWLMLFAGYVDSAYAATISLSVPGYSADVGVHEPRGPARNVIVISLHGKEKGRWHSENLAFAERLARAGYTVYTPQMPWYDYSAPVSTAFVFLDALVEKVATTGEKVVVTGHSQGAPFALFYTTAHKAPPQVTGVILLAPGHLIHRSRRMREATASDVALAKQLVVQGQADERHSFSDFNDGGGKGTKHARTTARTYLSYFDPETSPNFLELITQARLPILWVDGEHDGLAQRMDYAGIYATAPKHPHNRYVIVRGGHVDMWANAAAPAIDWLMQFD